MQIFTMAQYSPEWWQVRCGIPTASCFSRIITAMRGEVSKAQKSYIAELIADRANPVAPFFTSRTGHTQAMRNGSDCEPEARKWYEFQKDLPVRQVGFIKTDCGRFGASPDGLVGAEGGLELKCPELKTHAAWLLAGTLPREHKCQVHGGMAVTGLRWWDFVSYAPGLDPLCVRVEWDQFTDALVAALEPFWDLYNETSRKILNEPAPGERIDPEAFQATMDTITDWLAGVQTPEQLQSAFIDLADARKPVKAAAWQKIKAKAEEKGWAFDAEAKRFVVPAQSAF